VDDLYTECGHGVDELADAQSFLNDGDGRGVAQYEG
jgi:hypothetical protein